ncbi:MAG: dTDP-glucose 4,6-dehydratase [Candidatus Woesebacteria bacterium GW2011_GWB1_38_5]|uniref:dTDP-glucose 4,6-dehydratase n=4 Tax=Candidatus Woeseibacteriota TaxID=1752722 RepID=A0A0G0P650_9BACT|nr:MAG: dTDP-glucose 4,6-dehydratase [Candidatus Woesebacteria bacterium GW2011_GWD1_38_10]KKQ56227.1 MAG: dTDP-glucose 4,6-dehydratase [Candidatus Woesebacteria bacterium GW2011_GWC1_38_13]KKQ74954.1 MAG: dTDP-glucose 4,6-dehydratase [Candidatus Woesebacteria bacterium GW2011_GWB1_38_5]KKQ84786.1 MAG: dTDP-glucose 4,6-dehydratase [Candidatus Woesebacteria bacterium GW2011_GWA1_38_8]
MNLLVTGGAGFIGNNFIRYWLNKYPKDKILNFDKLTYAGHISSTRDFSQNNNYEFIKGDVCDAKAVDEAVKKTDTIVHFAAESHVDRSILDPLVFVHTNVMGTQVLLEAAVKYKINRFHHVSTDEVFGELKLGTNKKFNETTQYDPKSPYSASKAASDHLVRAYGKTYSLPITISNCSNNYGPFQDPEKFIPRAVTNLIDGKSVPIYGDGKYTRDWLYVEDHVRAIETILTKGKAGETYLIGGLTEDINNLEVVRMILKILNINGSYIKYVKDRAAHDRRYAVDWRKIHSKLKWKPMYGFDTWLEKTVEWYKNNEWWWRPLKKKAEVFYRNTEK